MLNMQSNWYYYYLHLGVQLLEQAEEAKGEMYIFTPLGLFPLSPGEEV